MSEPHRFRFEIDLGDVVIEIVSIVVAILLALGVHAWQTRVGREARLHAAVENVARELARNRLLLAPLAARHRRVEARLLAAYRAAAANRSYTQDQLDRLEDRIAPRGFGVLQVQSIAWQIAQSDRALGLMPYDRRAALTAIYLRQGDLKRAYASFIALVQRGSLLAPRNAYGELRALVGTFGDVVAAEDDVLHDYATEIPALVRQYRLAAPRGAPAAAIQEFGPRRAN